MSIAKISGTFVATGQSASVVLKGDFNLTLQGGRGTVKLEKSYDNGTTWFDVSKDADGTPASYSLIVGQEIALTGHEPESDVLYRVNCTDYISDTIVYRLSQ